MAASPHNGFVVRPFRAGDSAGVRAVLEASYGEAATPALTYDWWSFGFAGATSGFMVAEAAGRIVGVQPMEIFPCEDGGTKLRGAMLTGVAVHPEFRRRGIFSELVTACENEAWRQGAAFVATMPNEKSRPGFLKAGYADLGRRRLLVRPVRATGLGGKIIPVLGHLAGAVAGLVQSAVKSIPARNGWTVREIHSVPAEAAMLAEEHAQLFPGLRLRRDADWLSWRYLESPLRKYRLFEARDGCGKLCGLAVATLDARAKVRVCYLMDILLNDVAVAAVLVRHLCEWAAVENADAVAAVVSSKVLASVLQASGLWIVPVWLPVKKFYSVVRFNPHQAVPAGWRTLAGWYQTLADWDNL